MDFGDRVYGIDKDNPFYFYVGVLDEINENEKGKIYKLRDCNIFYEVLINYERKHIKRRLISRRNFECKVIFKSIEKTIKHIGKTLLDYELKELIKHQEDFAERSKFLNKLSLGIFDEEED